MRALSFIIVASGLGLATVAAAQQSAPGQHPGHDMMPMKAATVTRAVAVLSPSNGGKVEGLVTFDQVDGGVKVTVDVAGLTPGNHGFHIHEFGDCSAPDFMSAGPHFMMTGQSHGSPADSLSHEGDMGNLTADSTGHAHAEWLDPHLSFSGPGSILGRGVIVHEKEDDLKTQPTGNSGARVACGTIGIAKP